MRINCRARRHKFKGTRPAWSSATISLAMYQKIVAPYREAYQAAFKKVEESLLQMFMDSAEGFALHQQQQILGLETPQVTQCQNPSTLQRRNCVARH